MYGHTFITYGHDAYICAYNVAVADKSLDANIGDHIGPNYLNYVLLTLISWHHAKIVGQKRG